MGRDGHGEGKQAEWEGAMLLLEASIPLAWRQGLRLPNQSKARAGWEVTQTGSRHTVGTTATPHPHPRCTHLKPEDGSGGEDATFCLLPAQP